MLSLNSLVYLQCFFLSPSHSQTIKFQSFALACLSLKPLPLSSSIQVSVTCSERVTQLRWVEWLCKCKVSKFSRGETDFYVWLKKTLRSKRGRSSYFSERMKIFIFKNGHDVLQLLFTKSKAFLGFPVFFLELYCFRTISPFLGLFSPPWASFSLVISLRRDLVSRVAQWWLNIQKWNPFITKSYVYS